WGVASVDAATIDLINIRQASWLAMRNAVADLVARTQSTLTPDYVLIDGLGYGDGPWPYRAIVKGDTRSLSIAAASIIAKETRDRLMIEFDAQFPQYGFAQHKGYGSPQHLRALREHGACALHRRSFAPVRAVCTPEAGSQLPPFS
ncbi:MAG: ribonuclease, partial [Abditibacteriota bacterium]|nr:ribonuclease [Abditibacteriota bacterium]